MTWRGILETVEARLAMVKPANGFLTSIGQHVARLDVPAEALCPACVVRLGPRAVQEGTGDRQLLEATLTIEAYHPRGSRDDVDVALDMLADIQNACEYVTDKTLGGLVSDRMAFLSDEIFYPEWASTLIACQVVYSVPHFRHYGDASK